MITNFSLSHFIKEQRLALFDVAFLSILESGLFVAQFYFIGRAINDLLDKSWLGIYILAGVFTTKIIVSHIKQLRVGKAYKTIYDQLITRTIGEPLEAGENLEHLTPKSAIIYAIANFFKTDLIKGFETIIRLAFVLAILFIINKAIFAACLSLGLIVFILYRLQKSKTIYLSHQLALESKKEYAFLKRRNVKEFYDHHRKLERLDQQLLGISSINLSIIEILSFALMIFSLVVLVRAEGQNALGTFFAMLYYVFAFSESMFLIPSVYQKYLKTNELSKMITRY